MTIETLHSFGLAILVFGVLPKVPTLFAVGLLSCVATVPALLQLVLPRTHGSSTTTVMVKWAVGLLALVGQLSAVGYFFVSPEQPYHRHLYWQVSVDVTH